MTLVMPLESKGKFKNDDTFLQCIQHKVNNGKGFTVL